MITLIKEEETFSACYYMNSPQKKLSAVGLVFFFNLYPVGILFTGQRPKCFIPSKRTLAKPNAEAIKNANSLSTFQNTQLLKNLNLT